ncbi:MAG: 50S ribosomal protein L4 [Solirubrobacteraceae bacterium]
MAETPPRVPPQRGSQSQERSVGDAKVLGASKKAKLDATAFGAPFNESLVHECVRAELAARRQGTHSTKTRGNVRGGGAKPWRQKGTGRARAGSSRSPIWTGGGTIFGPSPRHYTFKVNRKERRAALRSALSVHAGRDSIAILDPEPFDTPATKKAAALLEDSGLSLPTLVVLADDQEQAALSFRNIFRVSVLSASMVGVADLIGAASVVCSQAALDALTARANGTAAAQPEGAQA